jgi:hypothetical protein
MGQKEMAMIEAAGRVLILTLPATGNDDDYDVLADGAVVGRILKVHSAPRTPTHGYAATREAAIAAFREELAARITLKQAKIDSL